MKRFLAILLSCVMLTAVFTGASAQQTLFTAGTFTGEGKGYGGTMTLEVQVSDSEILAINVIDKKETPGISDPAFERIPAKILATQSVAVDTVSGCTMSSSGIIEAVTAALAQTCTNMSQLQTPVAATPVATISAAPANTIVKTADVVIVGSGGAGMSAALEALKAGSSVLLVEKNASVGGNTAVAGSAMNVANPERQASQSMSATEVEAIKSLLALPAHDEHMAKWQASVKADIEAYEAAGKTYLYDSPDLHKLQTYIEGDYVGNPKLIEIFGDNALSSLHFLTDLGAKWTGSITAAIGATWTRSHTPTQDWGSAGSSFVLPQEKAVKELGGKIFLEYKAEEIIMDDGRVIGIKGTTAEGVPFIFTAGKGVVLATGGFGANVEMRQKYNVHWANLDETIETTNIPSATGDGIVMAEAVGANLIGMEWIQMLPTGKIALSPTINNSIFVNNRGERFVKEDGRRDELSAAVLEQPGSYYYKVVDAHTSEDELGGISYKGLVIEELVDGEYLVKGETVEDLAKQLNMDPAVLQASIDELNQAVETGVDKFGRAVFGQKLDKGPFYAMHGVAKVHHTMGGIEIDESCQVLNTSGIIIPGLYAAGEVTGGIHGSNRLGGNAITDVVTFGRIAGQSVAAAK